MSPMTVDFWEDVGDARATLLIQRASDSAVACIWMDLPPDDDCDELCFGDPYAYNNQNAFISSTPQCNLGGEWMCTTELSLAAYVALPENIGNSNASTIFPALRLQKHVSTECDRKDEPLSSNDLLNLLTGTGKEIQWQVTS